MLRETFIPYQEQEAGEVHPEHEFGTCIVEALTTGEHEAYFIGGYCRDLLLGLQPKDVDIATSATPEEVQACLAQAGIHAQLVQAAEAYPVVLAKSGDSVIEIATFRRDVYADPSAESRRPDAMEHGTILDDASRRDLTINALYYNPLTHEVLDPTEQGMADLEEKLIRFIGDPAVRIQEDRVRILRAVRFRHRFGFDYAPETETALRELRQEVEQIKAKDRIGDELTRMFLLERRREVLEDLDRLGLLELLLPEYTQGHGIAQPPEFHSEGDVWTHQQMVVSHLPADADKELVWGTILHDIGKKDTYEVNSETGRITFNGHDGVGADMADVIARRYILQSKAGVDPKAVHWLVENHMCVRNLGAMRRSKQIAMVTHPQFGNLLHLLRADNLSSLRPDGSVDNESLAVAQRVAAEIAAEQIAKLPTIKEDLNMSGLTFIEYLGIENSEKRYLSALISYLDEAYQNGEVTGTPEEKQAAILALAAEWWQREVRNKSQA